MPLISFDTNASFPANGHPCCSLDTKKPEVIGVCWYSFEKTSAFHISYDFGSEDSTLLSLNAYRIFLESILNI